ncbi:MAG: tetratricopeptide repeat protein [Ardenticatenaceae bacterium]|nr:tetratricopeptide repeat protein [Ardenticatenaceae bacterium]MCB9445714.1 tetratricopeptide repeat protein [Ardenticatenaceae bacterium]
MSDSKAAITRELVCDLAAYIPATLIRQIMRAGIPTPGETQTLNAATLFSDISGFTAMSEELASDGPRGAEELNRVLLLTFTGMIDVIDEMGGAVSHFHGDAMLVYFPDDDGQAAQRALACAYMMQQLMLTSFNRVVTNRPPGKRPFFDLTMKIGLGYGLCRETVVGDPAQTMEFVLAGTAVDQAAAAEKHAKAGQIIASQALLERARLPAPEPFNPVTAVQLWPPSHPIIDWNSCDAVDLQRMVTAVTPFIPPVIYKRTISGLSEMAEHRPVTSIFVQFDFDEPEQIDSGLLQAYFEWAGQVVTRFNSGNARLNRVLTGDKGNQLHIIFGAPVAPDAPDQAIRCALALQRERPAYVTQQRIGLAAGKVFACPVGASRRREYTVVGDVVNLSARLTQICQDGQVLTDKTTADRVRESIDFDTLPPVYLKGKQAEITPYQPRGDQGGQAQLQVFFNRWKRPLVGREQEIDLLLGGMDTALRGVGGVVAVYGSTGVGKTSLLAVGLKHWLESGGAAYAGEGQQHTSEIPYGPWISIWQDFLGLSTGMDTAAQVTAVTNRMTSLVPDCGDDIGLWRDILGLPLPQAAKLGELTAEVRQARFFRMVRQAFQTAAQQQPLFFILEGLHWADQSTLALIDELTPHLEDWPIFMGLSFRPIAELTMETLNQATCLPIVLSDLPSKYGRQMLQQLIGTTELPPAVEQHLGLRSREGLESPVNPLFLEEAVNVMMGLGVLQVNGRVQVNETLLTRMQIPDTIHGLLLARIDRLPVASRDLLQIASVIGRQFNLDPLVSLSPDTPRDVATSLLNDLAVEEITQLMTADPEWSYLFQHAMTHEVAYESLPFARRQTLHAAVADWLVKRYRDNLKPLYPVLAYHYSRADDHENGLRYALAAADSARDIFANQEAVELYTLAESHLQVLGEDERWETAVELYLSRGHAMRLLGDFATAIKDIEAGLYLALKNESLSQTVHAYDLLADIRYRQGYYDMAINAANEIINISDFKYLTKEHASAYLWLGMSYSALGKSSEAQLHLNQAEKLCLAIQDNQKLARVLEAIAFVYYQQKDLQLALKSMQQSVNLSRNVSKPINLASSLNNIALVQHQLGSAEEALETLNESIKLVRETSRNFFARFVGNRAEILTYLGRYVEAQQDFEQAINLFMLMDDEQALSELFLVMGYEHYSMIGNWSQANSCFQKAEKLINKEKFAEGRARLLIGKGNVALHTNQIIQSRQYFEKALTLIDEKKITWWRPAVLYYLAQSNLHSGDITAAKEQLLAAVKTVDNDGCPDYLPLIFFLLAQLEENLHDRQQYLESCVKTAEKRARLLDKVYCFERVASIFVHDVNPDQRKRGGEIQNKANELRYQLKISD